MLKILVAAAGAIALAAPATARDGSGYVGIEGGVLKPQSQDIFGSIDFTAPPTGTADLARTRVASLRYKMGYDVDLIGGYDFGLFRLEGELGYKRAKTKSVRVNDAFVTAFNAGAGTLLDSSDFDLNSKTSVYSAMVNGLLDFGGNGGIGAYVGGGVGYAKVKQFGSSSGKFAWQLLAGVYAPISDNIDVGLKYRYFRAGRNNGSESVAFAAGAGPCGPIATPSPCSGGIVTFDNDGRFTSHSLLASLVFNFGAAAAPPPPPPPPPPPHPVTPATQTCPDGSVILATSTCPVPPPPPPPAPAERGERGR